MNRSVIPTFFTWLALMLILSVFHTTESIATDPDGASPPQAAVNLEEVGPSAAVQELERGGAVYTLGDPAELRAQLGIPTYAVSNPGPLLGYAIRRLPSGRYADIYVCASDDPPAGMASQVPGGEDAGASRVAPPPEVLVLQAVDSWRTQEIAKAADGPGNAWQFGQWTRWQKSFPGAWEIYAAIDFSLYQLADSRLTSDYFLCDVRFETLGGWHSTGIYHTGQRYLTLYGTYFDGLDSTVLLEHGPSTTVGGTETSYTTGSSVSGEVTAGGGPGVGWEASSTVTHGWSTPCISTLNRSSVLEGSAGWEESFDGYVDCSDECLPATANYASFPSAIFRIDDHLGGSNCGSLTCKLGIYADVIFSRFNLSQGCVGIGGITWTVPDAWIEWGLPQGPEIFDFWPPDDPDRVNVGEFVDFSVTAADLNGCDVGYTWRLDGQTVSTDPEYRFTASCFQPGAMTVEVLVSSNGGFKSRRWLVRVNDASRIPPSPPLVQAEGGHTTLEAGEQVTLRAGTGGASDFTWETDCGSIIGTGSSVIYQAPDEGFYDPVLCNVTVTAANDCGASEPAALSLEIVPHPFMDIGAGLPGVYLGAEATWGDYDNDGDLDLVLAGYTGGETPTSSVYRNDAGTFTDIGAGLTGVSDGSAAWGDYDNDGDLDLVLAGYTGGETPTSSVYRNDAGTFTDIGAGLTGVSDGSVAWGDYDNDGDLDILLSGDAESGLISRIYRNEDGAFSDVGAGLPGVYRGSVAWGDYDNDGDLDIVLAGWDSTGTPISRVYRNEDSTFSDVGAGLPGVHDGSAVWGDYDNDGDLDLVLVGDTGAGSISRVYRNDAGTFTDIGAGLLGVQDGGSAAWGDYDNDGDPDLVLTGWSTESPTTSRVYRNDAGTFTDIGAGLLGVQYGSAAWGDYDNDGDLDLVVTGTSLGIGRIARVYRNRTPSPNTPPTAPGGLAASRVGDHATFSWNAATDAETPAAGLSYNLRIGTTPGGSEIMSAMADAANGYRRIPALGNAQQLTSWVIDNLPAVAYWSVQAVDGAFAGSPFATEERVVVPFVESEAGLPGIHYGCAAWGDYDGDGDLDLALTGETDQGPISRVYRNDAGTFTDIAAGLPGVTSSAIAWGDYDGDGDIDLVLSGDTGSGYSSNIYRNDAGTFTDSEAGLPGLTQSTVAWGDYDNDGGLDLLLAGWTGGGWSTRLFRNSDGEFADVGAGLRGVAPGSLAWGDYDNDGDLDILLTGKNSYSTGVACIYRNDAGTFTELAAGLPTIAYGSGAWGDYDNDGDLDVALAGYLYEGMGYISGIYRNDAGSFIDIGAGLIGVGESSTTWGDYDNDGDLDLVLAGYTGSSIVSRIYRNDAGVFTDIQAGLPGVGCSFNSESSALWGDFDNDGDLDLLLAGETGSECPGTALTSLYRNNATVANTPPAAPNNLASQVEGDLLTLSWDAASDTQTPSSGLTYNVRVGTTPGGSEIMSAMADSATGYRRVVQLGNANHNTSWTIALPEPAPSQVYWSVQALDACFAGSPFAMGDEVIPTSHLGAEEIPTRFAIHPVDPNPFRELTTIRLDVPEARPVRLDLFNVAGRKVRTVLDQWVVPPGHTAIWDGRDERGRLVAPGIYFLRLEAGSVVLTRKVVRNE